MNTAQHQAPERRYSKVYARELRGLHNYARIRVLGPEGRPTTIALDAVVYARLAMKAGSPRQLNRVAQDVARCPERRAAYLQTDKKQRQGWSEVVRTEVRRRLQTSAA